MIRIIIEIDDKQVSVTTSGATAATVASPAPPADVLARAMELGATNAGSAPGEGAAGTPFSLAGSTDAGAAPTAEAPRPAAARPAATRTKVRKRTRR